MWHIKPELRILLYCEVLIYIARRCDKHRIQISSPLNNRRDHPIQSAHLKRYKGAQKVNKVVERRWLFFLTDWRWWRDVIQSYFVVSVDIVLLINPIKSNIMLVIWHKISQFTYDDAQKMRTLMANNEWIIILGSIWCALQSQPI